MLEIVANAKVNLFLEITGKLSNGYHTVDTVMQSVSQSDVLRMELLQNESGIIITCSDPEIPTDERNIAYKVARDYLDVSGAKCGVSIDITKNIPSQAGMGGGSADGAAVLVGLNHLCGELLSIESLKDIASKNGADIPFCIGGGTQRLSGIGTDLVERYSSPKLPLVIVKPMTGISTPAAYRYLDSIHNDFIDHVAMNPDDLLESLRSKSCGNIGSLLYNRFEEVLEDLCADSLNIISWLKGQGCSALLSGSGTAVFGIAKDLTDAQKIADSVSIQFPDCFTCVCETTDCGCSIIK